MRRRWTEFGTCIFSAWAGVASVCVSRDCLLAFSGPVGSLLASPDTNIILVACSINVLSSGVKAGKRPNQVHSVLKFCATHPTAYSVKPDPYCSPLLPRNFFPIFHLQYSLILLHTFVLQHPVPTSAARPSPPNPCNLALDNPVSQQPPRALPPPSPSPLYP
jgi:hypothetical protein